jgi:hypothetical protein
MTWKTNLNKSLRRSFLTEPTLCPVSGGATPYSYLLFFVSMRLVSPSDTNRNQHMTARNRNPSSPYPASAVSGRVSGVRCLPQRS